MIKVNVFCNLRELERLSELSNAVLPVEPEHSAIIHFDGHTKVDRCWRKAWCDKQNIGKFGAVFSALLLKNGGRI